MINTARQIVRSCPFVSSVYDFGLHAGFMRMPRPRDKWGIKLFRDCEIRDISYDLQDMARTVGAAPKLGKRFTEMDTKGQRLYGFLTEAIYATEKQRYYGFTNIDIHCSKDYNMWWQANRKRVHELNGKLNDIGITAHDTDNWANVGELRGELVCIDFSIEERI